MRYDAMAARLRAPIVAAVLAVLAGCGTAPESAGEELEPGGDTAVTLAAAQRAGAGRLRVLYAPAEGFAARDDAGRVQGITADIMRAFAAWVQERRRIDVELEFVEEPDWRTFYRRVRDGSGGVFGLGNVTITEPRRAELRFSPPYMTNVAVLITHESVPELRTPGAATAAFATLRPLAFEGTLHEARVRDFRDAWLPGAAIAHAASNDEILAHVAGGGYFAWIDGYNYWRARERGAPLRRHPVGDDAGEEFGIIMPLDSDWAPLLDEFLALDGPFRTSAEYRASFERHLGAGLAALLDQAATRP